MRILRLTQPASEPLSRAAAKLHSRIDHDDEDDLVDALIGSARQAAEDYCNRLFVSARLAILFDGALPAGRTDLWLGVPDITAIEAVTYVDDDGAAQTWGASNYALSAERALLVPSVDWPTGSKLRVEVTAGNDDSPVTVPPPVLAAIKLTFGALFEHREDMVVGTSAQALPIGARALLDPYRERLGL